MRSTNPTKHSHSSFVHFVPSTTISFNCNLAVLIVETIDSENEDQSEVEVANGRKKPIGAGAVRSILRIMAWDLSKARAEICRASTRGRA